MKLKCIGGPHDGEYKETFNRRYNDIIVIINHENTPTVNFEVNTIPSITKTEYAYYKIEKLGWVKDGKHKEWTFLLYEKLTIHDIFDKLFT